MEYIFVLYLFSIVDIDIFYINVVRYYNVFFCRYYPFYYAPFASDVKRLSQFKISFTVDKPLRPFDQLMAVLPPERHVCS